MNNSQDFIIRKFACLREAALAYAKRFGEARSA